MSDNSPYVIRLELLKLARDIVMERNANAIETIRMNWSSGPIIDAGKFPDLPATSTEEVLEVAEMLNDFVSKKG